jgi:hypothetical protein
MTSCSSSSSLHAQAANYPGCHYHGDVGGVKEAIELMAE